MVSVFGCSSFPSNLSVFFYIKLEGYAEVFQPWTRDGGNVIALLRGPSDGLDETRRETQPMTPSESLRKELVTQYGELAVRYYEAALAEKLKHNTEKAINNLNQAVKASAKFFEAYVVLGDLQRQAKRLDLAEQAFRKAIALKPGAGEPYIDLGAVLLDKATAIADAGSADAATAVFKEAVDILKSASDKAPWSSNAYYYLGSAQYKLNQLADAEASLRASLEKQDPRQDARLMLVNIYLKTNRLKDALEQVNAYLAAVPDSPQRAAVLDLQAKLQKEVKAP
jgi:Tfp pilus assembly protein PilF